MSGQPIKPRPEMEVIPSAQLQQRDDWERLLMAGTISLADGLMLMLQTSAPATPYLIARLEKAFHDYQYGDADVHLEEFFGVAVSQRERRRQERLTLVSYVKMHVDGFHDQGFTLQDPAKFPDTAFEKAATSEALKEFTAGNLFHMYYKG